MTTQNMFLLNYCLGALGALLYQTGAGVVAMAFSHTLGGEVFEEINSCTHIPLFRSGLQWLS